MSIHQPEPVADLRNILQALPSGITLGTCLFQTAHRVGYAGRLALPYALPRTPHVPVHVLLTDAPDVAAWLTRYEGLDTMPLPLPRVITSGERANSGWYTVALSTAPPDAEPLPQIARTLTPPQRVDLVQDVAAVMDALHRHDLTLTGLTPDHLWLDPETRRLRHVTLPLWVPLPGEAATRAASLDTTVVLGWNELLPPQLQADLPTVLQGAESFCDLRLLAALNPFTAPEYLQELDSAQADVYTLGMLIYWLFYRRVPFMESMFLALHSATIPALQVVKAIEAVYAHKLLGQTFTGTPLASNGLRMIVEQATAGQPTARQATPGEVAASLEALVPAGLRVTVHDDEGFAVPDLLVQAIWERDVHSVTTDANGVAVFPQLLAGTYTIETEDSDEYEPLTLQVLLTEGELRQIVLVPPFKTALHGIKKLWRRLSDRL